MRGSTVGEINTIFNKEYFGSSVVKGKSAVIAVMYIKKDIKVLKILKCTFLDKSPQKVELFELNLQYI